MIGQKKRTLYVICEDDQGIVSNYINKLIYSNDDVISEEGTKTIGVKDGSTDIVCGNYSFWDDTNNQVVNKVLFINEKEADKELAPIIDVKFSDYGIVYGWAGRQAYIKADPNVLLDSIDKYEAFYKEYSKNVEVSDIYKEKLLKKEEIDKTNNKVLNKLKAVSQNVTETVEKVKQKKNIHIQQTLFAVRKFYTDNLDEFLNQ